MDNSLLPYQPTFLYNQDNFELYHYNIFVYKFYRFDKMYLNFQSQPQFTLNLIVDLKLIVI